MGLLDVLNGIQNGPRGQRGTTSRGGGGMSPMAMAILGLLAFKAVKSFTGSQPSARPASPGAVPGGGTSTPLPGSSGGLRDLLKAVSAVCSQAALPAAS